LFSERGFVRETRTLGAASPEPQTCPRAASGRGSRGCAASGSQKRSVPDPGNRGRGSGADRDLGRGCSRRARHARLLLVPPRTVRRSVPCGSDRAAGPVSRARGSLCTDRTSAARRDRKRVRNLLASRFHLFAEGKQPPAAFRSRARPKRAAACPKGALGAGRALRERLRASSRSAGSAEARP